MIPEASDTDRPLPVALLGGGVYAVGVLAWALTTGIRFPTGGPTPIPVGLVYGALGMFLVAAVPLYLLGRLSLVSPTLVAMWSLANTIYLRWYVPRPHDALASYLTIWPLIFGLVAAVAILEFGVRTASDRTVGRFGLRSLF